MDESKTQHYRRLFTALALFALVQVAMLALSGQRACQYYVRIGLLVEINIMLTLSLALINGYTGQFSIGHAGFMAIGAYTSVLVTTILPRLITTRPLDPATLTGHLLFIASVAAAGGVAGVFGLLIGFPTLRLRGDYLAIVTLAAGEVIRALLKFTDFVGGPRGVTGIPRFGGRVAGPIYIGLALLGSIWVIRNYVFSHFGRACIAVRDNEIAAASMGINVTFQKVSAFVVGAFFGGVAGALFAHLSQYINPDNFGLLKSLDLLIFLYVGGAHTLAGGIVGAGLFTLLPEALRLANLESWRMVVYPLVLIAAMRFRREGIMGKREFPFLIPWKYKEMGYRRGQYDSV